MDQERAAVQQLVERAHRSGVGVVRVHNIRGKIAQPLPHPAQQQRVGRAPARQAQNGQTFITQQLRQLSRTRTGHQRLHVGCAGQRAGQIIHLPLAAPQFQPKIQQQNAHTRLPPQFILLPPNGGHLPSPAQPIGFHA